MDKLVHEGEGAGNPAFAAKTRERAASEQAITERIFSAVLEQRLPPGIKLPENALCEAYGVSRARIRRVLLMLAERGVVELHSNRGAFVARPSPEDARNVLAARRSIEPSIMHDAARRIADEQLADLRKHVELEAAAQATRQRREAIRLSGRFHVRLAEIAGNPVLTRIIAELVARSSLIIGLFGTSGASCFEDEHRILLEAIGDRDAARASELMVRHLEHIEKDLELTSISDAAIDLRVVLAS
jgi:DNA-binding GntR family transcriptional regulator